MKILVQILSSLFTNCKNPWNPEHFKSGFFLHDYFSIFADSAFCEIIWTINKNAASIFDFYVRLSEAILCIPLPSPSEEWSELLFVVYLPLFSFFFLPLFSNIIYRLEPFMLCVGILDGYFYCDRILYLSALIIIKSIT